MHVPKLPGIYGEIPKIKHLFFLVGFCPVVTILAFLAPFPFLAVLAVLWAVYAVWVYRCTVGLLFALWVAQGDPPQGGAPIT